MKNLITFTLLFAGIAVLTACGGGGSAAPAAGTDPTTTPTTPPVSSAFAVNSASPVAAATQKSDFPIVAIFSQPVDETKVDSSSFQLSDGVIAVAGTFSFSDDKTVVIFTPASDLTDAVIYTVTINTSLSSITSESLAGVQTWSFTASDKANYSCVITSPPAGLGLDPYYTKYCDANGMPILGGNLVSVAALQEAWSQTMNMMKMRQDLFAEMVKQGTKVAIVAEGEGITQIPEYSDLDTVFPLDPPGTSWDDRARGLGATSVRPLSSGAEENVLCTDIFRDVYYGESIFIHEFAHSVEGMGLFFTEPDFSAKILVAYESAKAAGLFVNTYADDTVYEYWAEGVQDWFNVNLEGPVGGNGIHNEINTRAELKSYDPALYNLISKVFPADWQPTTCP